MFTVLIVDDEKNIRAGIRKILAESVSAELSYVEAKNGEEALACVDSSGADLVITDIRMPRMDGIELMRRLAERPRRPTVIVLSGYDEFSYAKEAMRFGAVSYILKPVDRSELVSVVTETVAAIERQRKRETEKAIRRVMAEGRVGKGMVSSEFSFDLPFVFAVVTGRSADGAVRAIAGSGDYFEIERKEGSVSLLLRESALVTLESAVEAMGEDDACVGSSATCASLANLRTAWRQAVIASYARFFERGRRAFRFVEGDRPAGSAALHAAQSRLISLIGSGDQAAIADVVASIFSFDAVDRSSRARRFFAVHEFISSDVVKRYWEYADSDMYLGLKALMIERASDYRSLDDYRKSVLDFILYLDSRLRVKRVEYPFVDTAIDFMRGHFREDINMSVVANHVSVNYTYFSEKFKEHTGVNFNDYLKRLRIDEAKRELEKGCFRVYEVAANSGFGDVKHFTKTFKEITGLSPGEYRKKF